MEPNDERSGIEEARQRQEADTPPDQTAQTPIDAVGANESEPNDEATDNERGGPPSAYGEQHAESPAGAHPKHGAAGGPATPSGLDAGTEIGPYVVLRRLADDRGRSTYLAILREEAEGHPEPEATQPRYVLIEGMPGDHTAAAKLAALGLHHPRLLAPRALVAHEGREYLAIETACDTEGRLPVPASEGMRLNGDETLRAGAGLADALAYLHRNRVAHLHVSPETVLLLEGRAYLSGVEEATRLFAGEETGPLFARDANFLARTLETVSGIPETPSPDEPAAQAAIREIAARGLVNGFAAPDEVGLACTSALESALRTLALDGEEPPSARLVLRAGSATTVGMVRSQNQDALSVMSFDVRDDVPEGMPQGLFLVADGMGGEAHGELASRIAARTVSAELTRAFLVPAMTLPATAAITDDAEAQIEHSTVRELAAALTRAVEQANNAVRSLSERLGQATGTTLTALAIRGAHGVLAHVGDSRAYLLHGDTLMRLTEDHSLMARLEAIDHPLLHDPAFFMSRSILYRSLGQEEDAPPDLLDLPLNPGDRLLICSDGLWDELDDQTIGVTLASANDPEICARQLVEQANAAGGHDNSTAVVLFVERQVPDPAGERPAETDEDADDDELAQETTEE